MNKVVMLYARKLKHQRKLKDPQTETEIYYIREFDDKIIFLPRLDLKKMDFCFLFIINRADTNEELRKAATPGVICRWCGGSGHIPSLHPSSHDDNGFRFVDEKCPDCDGEGILVGRLFQKNPLAFRGSQS